MPQLSLNGTLYSMTKRPGGSAGRRRRGRCSAAGFPFHADLRAHLGDFRRRPDGHGRGPVLRNVSRHKGVTTGPG